jgi:hypothetical protein
MTYGTAIVPQRRHWLLSLRFSKHFIMFRRFCETSAIMASRVLHYLLLLYLYDELQTASEPSSNTEPIIELIDPTDNSFIQPSAPYSQLVTDAVGAGGTHGM